MPEARTVRPRATGHVSGDLSHPVYPQYYGLGRYSITVDSNRRDDKEFCLKVDENYGPMLTDHREYLLRFDREQATELRDALDQALAWHPDHDNEEH